jgi:hypothetical protein
VACEKCLGKAWLHSKVEYGMNDTIKKKKKKKRGKPFAESQIMALFSFNQKSKRRDIVASTSNPLPDCFLSLIFPKGTYRFVLFARQIM